MSSSIYDATYIVIDHRLESIKKGKDDTVPKHVLAETPYGKYLDLPIPEDKILATYIWIDGTGQNVRSKVGTLGFYPKVPKDKFTYLVEKMNAKLLEEAQKDIKFSYAIKYMPPYFCPRNIENIHKTKCKLRTSRNKNVFDENLKDLPIWTYDGSGTGQSTGINSDIFLFPRAIYNDPFRRGNNILVMCDTYDHNMEPTATNHRVRCAEAYAKCVEDEPWFGIEQEFFVMNCHDGWPYGWPKYGYPIQQGIYYCGVGAKRAFARELILAHYHCCLYAGIPMAGTNAEIAASQWEYQVGPSVGVNAGDDVWVARFILDTLAEEFGVVIEHDPKPMQTWNGSGAHTNFSTKKMREDNGIMEIEKAIQKLSAVHMKHIKVYDARGGLDNLRRLIGTCETGSIETFTAGIANRFSSIRIPRVVAEDKKGYLEDRRPASNCDPYSVVDALIRTCILNE